MAKRSLQAHQEGARIARKAFERKGWTQENLAGELDLKTRQPIWRFFTCRPVERYIFIELCSVLDLNWWEIAEQPPELLLENINPRERSPGTPPPTTVSLDEVRSRFREKIENQCSSLRVLDTSRPVYLDDLYVGVYLLSKVASRRRLEITDLQEYFAASTAPVNLGHLSEQLIPALKVVNQHHKLRILGKPGSGKTTFLKYVALQCSRGLFEPHRVPIFISLDNFAGMPRETGKLSLLNYLRQEFLCCGISDPQVVESFLTEGKFLLLLDGLDEVPEQESQAVCKEISWFSSQYYKNRFIVTSRLSNRRFEFSQFTDTEIADFNQDQLVALANNWFKIFTDSPENSSFQAAQLIQQLNLPENHHLRELATLPLLFNQVCQVFQKRGELITCQLEVYDESLEVLLDRWEDARGIQRDSSQPIFSRSHKLKVLSLIARSGLQQGRYFFERRELLQYIENYIHQSALALAYPDAVEQASEDMLRVLELQHGLLVERAWGIFSFSHIAFQNYFTARGMVLDGSLEASVALVEEYLTAPNWRDVVLLSCMMSQEQDRERLLQTLRSCSDRLQAQNPDLLSLIHCLQQLPLKSSFLQEVRGVSKALKGMLKTPAFLTQMAMPLAFTTNLAQHLATEIALDDLWKAALMVGCSTTVSLNKINALLGIAVLQTQTVGARHLSQSLRSLHQQLLASLKGHQDLLLWWQVNGLEWINQLGQAIAEWYEDGSQWQLNLETWTAYQHYCYIGQLQTDCRSVYALRESKAQRRSLPSQFPLYSVGQARTRNSA